MQYLPDDPVLPRRAVPRLWRKQQELRLRAFYGDLDICELADLRNLV